MSYGPSLAGLSQKVGTYAALILKGAKPSDLPIQQPTAFELVINSATARSLGIQIPPSLLLRADEVIEWENATSEFGTFETCRGI